MSFDETDNYDILYKLYNFKKIMADEPVIEPVIEVDETSIEYRVLNHMKDMVGLRNGTHGQIDVMFSLYNEYFKRREMSRCTTCVSNVYRRMIILYKELKNKQL